MKDIGGDPNRATATIRFELASEEDGNAYDTVHEYNVVETLAAACAIQYELVQQDHDLSSATLHASMQRKQAPYYRAAGGK